MADLSVDFCGIRAPNPFWLASAPPTDKAYNVERAFREAVKAKTGSDVLAGGSQLQRVFRFWTGDDTDATVVTDEAGAFAQTSRRVRRKLVRGVDRIEEKATELETLYDLVHGEIYRKTPERPLEIPHGAVVVPGARQVTTGRGPEWGLSVATPVIVTVTRRSTWPGALPT